MGLYLNTFRSGEQLGLRKSAALLNQPGVTMLDAAPTKWEESETDVLVCVVENYAFDTAGLVFSQRELESFSNPADARTRWWFLVPRDLVEPDILAAHDGLAAGGA